jgi:hypothetical protein
MTLSWTNEGCSDYDSKRLRPLAVCHTLTFVVWETIHKGKEPEAETSVIYLIRCSYPKGNDPVLD